jgi:hypothetical protein
VTRKLEVFHWALVTADFDQAAAQLSTLLGLTFAEAIESRRTYSHAASGELSTPHLRVAYSRQGPPYLELIEIVQPGGPCSAEDVGRIHHVGVWCEDIAGADRDALSGGGTSHYRVLDPASQEIFAVLTAPSPLLGTRVEYVSVAARPVIERWTSTGLYPR